MGGIRNQEDWRGRPHPHHFAAAPLSPFFEPDDAPFDMALQVQVTDGLGPYVLPFPCWRTKRGWVNGRGNLLAVQVVGWKRRDWDH